RAAELREHIEGAGEFVPVETEEASLGVDLSTADDAVDFAAEDDTLFDSEEFALDDDLELNIENEAAPLIEEESAFTLDLDDDSASLANDVSAGGTRYDLSFDEENHVKDDVVVADGVAINTADEAALDEDEFSCALHNDDTIVTVSTEEADDERGDFSELSGDSSHEQADNAIQTDDDFAFELDDLETPDTSGEKQAATAFEEDEFTFDLDEDSIAPVATAQPSSDLLHEPLAGAAVQEDLDEELQLPEDNADDFNLDMDMGDLDLAALDEEMKDLEADFVSVEAEELESEELGV